MTMTMTILVIMVITHHQVNEHRDRQISKMMDQIEKEMPDFDSCKCPPVK